MKIDTDEKISENFTLGEALWLPSWSLHCIPNEAQLTGIRQMAQKMELIRELFQKPILIHCWLRPVEYNKFIKGARNSAHIQGRAVDWSIRGLDCDEIRLELEKHLDEFQIRLEDIDGDWVHCDILEPQNGVRFFKP